MSHPGQSQLRHAAVELLGDGFELAHRGIFSRVEQAVAQKAHVLHRAPAACGDALAIFARQQARRQRAPGREPQADIVVEPGVLLLHPLAVEQVILRLLHHRLVQMVPLGHLVGGANLVGAPLAGAPVKRLALLDDVVQRPDGFFDGGVRIGAMTKDQVDEIQPHALEAAIDRLQQILAVQGVAAVDARFLGRARVEPPEKLARHHIVEPVPLELRQRLTHQSLAFAIGIDLGIVEKIDSRIARGGHHLAHARSIDLIVKRHPGAERKQADLQATAAKTAIKHGVVHGVLLRVVKNASLGRPAKPRACKTAQVQAERSINTGAFAGDAAAACRPRHW